jgi:hypothetical protein
LASCLQKMHLQQMHLQRLPKSPVYLDVSDLY